jgi:hypothetical protein
MRTPTRGRAVLLAVTLALGGCGRYAELAQKLDVTARVAGDTWIAAVGSSQSEVRVLLVGKPDANGVASFAYSSIQIPITRSSSAFTFQGTWTEVGASGATTLEVLHEYTLPDESSVGPFSRVGAQREDAVLTIPLTVTRTAGQLVVAGDQRLAATYVPLGQALAQLGTATARDAACAFQVANLGIDTSEVRIIGFGGVGMSQYQTPATYIGTVAGSLRVSLSLNALTFASTTTIVYSGFEDLGGVVVDGPQVTSANGGGDGSMSGVMTFALTPLAPDGSALAPITGTIDYGGAGNPANAIQITNGTATGGVYVISIDGGGTAQVPPQTAPSPSVAECLALP